MVTLQTVEGGRRRSRRVILTAIFGVFLVLGSATAWWALRGGEPVDSALGVEVAAGTRLIHQERLWLNDDQSSSYTALYLVSVEPVAASMERFGAIALERNDDSRRYILEDGTIITVAPAYEIPATAMSPIHPVADQIPLGARSWIVVQRGTPPESTNAIAVPPLGES